MTNLSQEPLADPVRVTDLGELLAGLPVLFGFRPVNSLIAVCLEGPRGRVGFRLRVDLPPVDLCDQVVDYLVDVLRRNHASTVLVVACSDAPAVADPVVAALVRRLRSVGVKVRDAVRCDGGRFWSYVCDDPECCPPEGQPYDTSASQLVAEAVLAGMEVLPDRAALAARVGPVSGAERERMEDATAAASVALFDALGGRDPATMQRDRALIEAGVRRVREVLDPLIGRPDQPLTDADAAALSVWCSLAVVRDTAWAGIDTGNAVEQLRVWSEVARRVVPPYELAVLGLAGFSAWLSGDGALAWCAIERADLIDPDDEFIELLRSLLVQAVPPSTWVPSTEERIWRQIRHT